MTIEDIQQRSRAGIEAPTRANKGWLTRALGFFSIGLGLIQIIAPDTIARWIGIRQTEDNRTLLRLVGIRELASAAGIFTQRRPIPWLWGRVAGDAMDLTLLVRTMGASRTLTNGHLLEPAPTGIIQKLGIPERLSAVQNLGVVQKLGIADRLPSTRRPLVPVRSEPDRVTLALAAVAGVAVLDLVSSIRLTVRDGRDGTPGYQMQFKRAITIDRSPDELYQFWRDFSNLPRFMTHLQEVHMTGHRVSHWKTKAPLGQTVEWDAEIIDEQPNELITWRSLAGADVENEGNVRFVAAPGGRGTEVRVEMGYNLPGGPIGKTIAALFGESPERQVYDDLRSLKQIMETGEVLYSDASIHGHPHPGQPPERVPQQPGARA